MLHEGGFRYGFESHNDKVKKANSHQLDQRTFNEACDYLRSNVIGSNAVLSGPFGNRKLFYADFTASGRSLGCIEEFITQEVLPHYGNTHTLASSTGSQTTYFRMEARQIIKQYFNATHDDALIFCGSGSTAAINKFVQIMNRSLWDVGRSVGEGAGGCRQGYFSEDRWGSCECTLCGIRLKNEAQYRAHEYSDGHQRRLKDTSTTSPPQSNHSSSRKPEKAEVPSEQPTETATDETPLPTSADSTYHITQRLVVLICDSTGHHSLLLPFRELAATGPVTRTVGESIVTVSFDHVELRLDESTGRFQRRHLMEELEHCRSLQRKGDRALQALRNSRPVQTSEANRADCPEEETTMDQPGGADDANSQNLSISFEVIPVVMLSAGSNVTGHQLNVGAINKLVHSFDGICCWDFAAVSSHSKIDFNPPGDPAAAIDAGFFSTHKYLGGPGAPGFLMMKSRLMRDAVPSSPGGGVVFYVTPGHQTYIKNPEEREEGGTPDILADIRAGLVYRLHSALSSTLIHHRESAFTEYLLRHWGKHKRIQLLGPLSLSSLDSSSPEAQKEARMGIISFMIKYGNNLDELPETVLPERPKLIGPAPPRQISARGGLYLHPQFVVALLNDLFGIQVRGGCACAGPYGQFLLGIEAETVKAFEECLEKTGQEVFRPGFVRVSVNYCMSWDDIELLSQSVLWVADFGWKFLPAYTIVPETGEWQHRVVKPDVHRRWLSGLTFAKTGAGVSVLVDGRMGQQRDTLATAENTEPATLPKKDPKRVAGAVALLGGEVDQQAFKLNLKAALTSLKKPATPKPAPVEEHQLTELELAIRRRSNSKAATTRVIGTNVSKTAADIKDPGTTKSDICLSELGRKLSLRRMVADAEQDSAPFTPAPLTRATDVPTRPKLCRSFVTTGVSISSDTATVSTTAKPIVKASRPLTPGNGSPSSIALDKGKKGQGACESTGEGVFVAQEIMPSVDAVKAAIPAETSPKQAAKKPFQGTARQEFSERIESVVTNHGRIRNPAPARPTLQEAAVSVSQTTHDANTGLETLFLSDRVPEDLEGLMGACHEILETLFSGGRKSVLKNVPIHPLPAEFLHLLWFALPCDAAASLLSGVETPSLSTEELGLLSPGLQGSSRRRPISSCFEVRLFDGKETSGDSPTTCSPLNRDANEASIDYLKEFLVSSISDGGPPHLNFAEVMKAEINANRLRRQTEKQALSEELQDMKAQQTFHEPSRTPSTIQRRKNGLLDIPRHLRRPVGSAIRDFNMIREGDRLLVGLSGGKDSLTLLHILRDLQKRSPVKFELAAATVDPQTPEYDPSPLIPYMEELNVPYHFLSFPLIELAKSHMQKDSLCSFCSRMKRGILYSCMRKFGYTVLVLGQHLDDICESFIMSAFHNGSLNTMKAHYTASKGDVRICRPLIYTRERLLARFARDAQLPVIQDNCPGCFAQPKERHRVKLLLAQQEFEFPNVFQILLKTVRPLISVSEVHDTNAEAAPSSPAETADDEFDKLAVDLVNGTSEAADVAAEVALTSCAGGVCPRA